jgi:hypothetical protein
MRRLALVATFVIVLLAVLVGGHLYLAERLVWAPDLPPPWRPLALLIIAGGAVSLLLVGRGRLNVALPVGLMLVGTPLVMLAWLPLAAAAMVLLVVLGVGYALVEVAGLTLLQRHAADRVRARAFGVVESTYWLTTGAGAMLAPPLVALVGARTALALVAAALPVVVIAYSMISSAREMPSASTSKCVTARTVDGPVAPIRTP